MNNFKKELIGFKYASEILKLSDQAKVDMLQSIYSKHNTRLLSNIVDIPTMTKLLKKYKKISDNIDMENNIEKIINEFDFEKVHDVMTYLNWTWGDNIPTTEEMKIQALGLLNDVKPINKNRYSSSYTGGFKATYVGNNKFNLTFIVENYDNHDEDDK